MNAKSIERKMPGALQGWTGGMLLGGALVVVGLARSATVREHAGKLITWVAGIGGPKA